MTVDYLKRCQVCVNYDLDSYSFEIEANIISLVKKQLSLNVR